VSKKTFPGPKRCFSASRSWREADCTSERRYLVKTCKLTGQDAGQLARDPDRESLLVLDELVAFHRQPRPLGMTLRRTSITGAGGERGKKPAAQSGSRCCVNYAFRGLLRR
jgi:hypothetical protein